MAMIQGKARWFKVLGKPIEGYDPGEKNKQWEFDLDLDNEGVAYMEEQELGHLVKKRDDGTPFVKWVKRAYNKDGEATKPITVVGPDGEPWDRSILVGNGSIINVKFFPKDWTFGKKSGRKANIGAVQVWEHVPYEGGEAFPTREKAKAGPEQWGNDEGEGE